MLKALLIVDRAKELFLIAIHRYCVYAIPTAIFNT
jgi:hypothetical protein